MESEYSQQEKNGFRSFLVFTFLLTGILNIGFSINSSNFKSEYLKGDFSFCGMGKENILPSFKIGEGPPPALESKPLRLKISLFKTFMNYYSNCKV